LANPITPASDAGSPIRGILPAPRILNSPLIRTNIYPGLFSHLGRDANACMTHTSEV
uniref:Gag protein n=1 Tax=Mesocestoides corti TaxID=53468 RepID=A0A5K3EK61_MESCO